MPFIENKVYFYTLRRGRICYFRLDSRESLGSPSDREGATAPSCLTFGLVYACKSTFFLAEATSLVNDHDRVTIAIYLSTMMRFAESKAKSACKLIMEKRKYYSKQKMELLRIGIGMAWGGLCCAAAWVTATRRQHHVMNICWLIPQFLLLGLMLGCAQHGLRSFYKSQVSKSLWRYGMPFGELVEGVGKFSSVLCIGILRRRPFRWFRRHLKDSRLDNYYFFLEILCFVTLVIYCKVARWYAGDAFLVEDGNLDPEQPDVNLPPRPNSHDAATQLVEPAVHETTTALNSDGARNLCPGSQI
ncbi:protein NRT1/ PTR FAMILY 5.5-like [Salvia hispanica]|uniref:protein NRT1/ PTR FAMILY 5.5-like n=1 Tax=Salvia hispanica TaxID=49212 RepID=UPI0020096319|nr:protein NRT1/ PTR FAMILY 5.5-like [Salvia hispanica]